MFQVDNFAAGLQCCCGGNLPCQEKPFPQIPQILMTTFHEIDTDIFKSIFYLRWFLFCLTLDLVRSVKDRSCVSIIQGRLKQIHSISSFFSQNWV